MAKSSGGNKFLFYLKRIFLFLLISHLVYLVITRWVDPPITVTQIGAVFSGQGLKRDYINYNEMGNNIKLAVMAGEDQLFPDHDGFDFKSIEKALKHNQKSKSLRGASTISQQTAKNVFLWQGRSYVRKGLEVYFTFMTELWWGKERILENYLNVIEMGDGVFGVEAAAQHYFHKHAKDLSRPEAALIAACLPNPHVFNPARPSAYIQRRQAWILKQMNNLDGDPDIQELLAGVPPKPKEKSN